MTSENDTTDTPTRLGPIRRVAANRSTFTCADHPDRPGAWLLPDGTLRCDRCHIGADAVTAERQRIADWLLRLVAHPDTISDWKARHDLDSQYVGMALRALAADLTSGEPIPGLDDEPAAGVVMSERWGICGTDWREIRPMRDKGTAYDCAYSIANYTVGPRDAIDVYVDKGDGSGWTFVEHVAIGATR